MNELETIKKQEIAEMMMEVEFSPVIPDMAKTNHPNQIKLPIEELESFGIAFQPLVTALQSLTTGQGGSGIYYVNTGGKTMFNYKNSFKFLGSLKNENGLVGGGQAQLTQIPCDPTMICVGAALATVEKKLDAIQEIQEEMMDFLTLKEKSEMRGDLIFLSDMLSNYKYNWNNEQYIQSNYNKVLDIKCSMEGKILFYREQITSKIEKQSALHSDKDVKKQLSSIIDEFTEYQLAIYLFSFASLLDVMLLENYNKDYLTGIENKISDYSLAYKELYTDSYNKLDGFANSSIESNLLGALASANTATGKVFSKVPLFNKVQLGEKIIESGEKIDEFKKNRYNNAVISLAEKQNSNVKPFVEQISMINTMYNEPLQICFDKENLYINA